jgi:hypothetical protein
MNTPPRIPDITGLRGLWTRSLIAWPDGRRDTTTQVQAPSVTARPEVEAAEGV